MMFNSALGRFIKDIRFYIVIFFLIRLIGITQPPIEIGHNWRQTVVNMVARNFIETDNNILYPRIDIAGEKSGITGMEFPLLNYLIYLLSLVFGFEHWYGRLINLIFSSFGLYFFYLLLKKYFSTKLAFFATFILSVSIWFQFSRKIMPDTFSMSLIIASLFFGSNYLEKNKTIHLFLFGLLFCLGALSKISSAYAGAIFLLFIFNRNIPVFRKVFFSIVSMIVFVPIVFWYFYWAPFLTEKHEFWHFFMGSDLNTAFNEITHHVPDTLRRFYDSAFKYTAFILFIAGIYLSIKNKNWLMLQILLISTIAFGVFIFKAGFYFYHHNYYIIPFVPVMAILTAYALENIRNKKIVIAVICIIFLENSLSQIHENKIKKENKYLITLEAELDKIMTANDLIIINSGFNPTPMYFAHRKGWVEHNAQIANQNYIEALRNKGLKYILILKHNFGTEIELPQYKKITENASFSVYSVNDKW